MQGIQSYGAYVPFNRIARKTIGAALETRGGPGERAVASYDEDTATMAVEAARACLTNADPESVQALTFVTTNPPYIEKLNAATIHAALGLAPNVRAADAMGSVRAGGSAMAAAAHSGETSLVTMSDIRLGAPEGAAEQAGGDGAAAFLFGDSDPIAEVIATYSETLEHLSLWRLPGETFAKTWEERFSLENAYIPLLGSALKNVLEQGGLTPETVTTFILDAPNPRAAAAIASTAGLSPEASGDPLLEAVGHTGPAHAGLRLAAALDTAGPGDTIAVVSASDGVDALLLRVTGAITSKRAPVSVADQIASKRNDLSYTRFLKWRNILQTERPRRPDPDRPAGPPAFRRRNWKFAFKGSECTKCGTKHLPPQAVCVKCGAQNAMTEVPFAERAGKVATFTLDRLAYTLQPPMVSAMIDFEGGGRVEMEITDCEPETVAIGNDVEMTFRRLFTADGVHNYFWKARPIRKRA
jgi:hydroxymethylglutaryl-CoA synthase